MTNPARNGRRPIEKLRHMPLPVVQTPEHWRPRQRAECIDLPRPCPFVSCRHHLALDVLPNGNIAFTAEDPTEMVETCALDVAASGDHTLEEVGDILGVSRERIRQIEYSANRRLERNKAYRSCAQDHTELDAMRSAWDVMTGGT